MSCSLAESMPWGDYCMYYLNVCIKEDCIVHKKGLCNLSAFEIKDVLDNIERCDYESNRII